METKMAHKMNILAVLREEVMHLEVDRIIPLKEQLKLYKVDSPKYLEAKKLLFRYEARIYEVFKLIKIWEGNK